MSRAQFIDRQVPDREEGTHFQDHSTNENASWRERSWRRAVERSAGGQLTAIVARAVARAGEQFTKPTTDTW